MAPSDHSSTSLLLLLYFLDLEVVRSVGVSDRSVSVCVTAVPVPVRVPVSPRELSDDNAVYCLTV
jgi:hypothetical protein